MQDNHFPALLAEVTRGGIVESRHVGHAVVVNTDGDVLFAAGDSERLTFPRSSLKPLQALAGIAAGTADRFDFTAGEIAVTCASHAAEPRHRAAVARILEKVEATEADLRCGPHPVPHLPSRDELILAGKEPTPIYSNCSGKHAGMLALARVLEAPLAGYWEFDHPVQRAVQQVLAAAADVDLETLRWGVDGCGVPTYLMSLRQLALGFARLARPESLPETADRPYASAAARIAAAMNAEPEMVRGEGGFDSVLMRALPGVFVCKGGAEGCEAVGFLNGELGIAVKVEDGAARPLVAMVMELVTMMGHPWHGLPDSLQSLRVPEVLNTRGEKVGEIRVVTPW